MVVPIKNIRVPSLSLKWMLAMAGFFLAVQTIGLNGQAPGPGAVPAGPPGANQPGPNQPGPNQPGPNQPGANQSGAQKPGYHWLDDLPSSDEGGGPDVNLTVPYLVRPRVGPPFEAQAHIYVHYSGLLACGNIDDNETSTVNVQIEDEQSRHNNIGVARYAAIATNPGAYDQVLQNLYQHFSDGVNRGPRFLPFYYNLATIALRLKKYEKARIYYKKARDFLPQFWGSHIGLGRTYELLGRKLDAVNSYRAALKANRLNFDAGISLGDYYFREKMWTRSAYYYNYVNKRYPGHPDSLTGLGKIAYARGDFLEAVLIFDRINFTVLNARKVAYKKDVHFYYARALVEVREFALAVIQFDKILQHPQDIFFVEVPYETVQRQRYVAENLARVKALSR